MQFEIAPDDMEPSELRYYKVMQPLWNELEERLDEVLALDWEFRETRSAMNLIAEAEVDVPSVDWIEIRGEHGERLDQLEGEDEILVRLTKWFGVVMLPEGYAASKEVDSEMQRTEAQDSIEEAVDALYELLDELNIELDV